MSSYSVNKRAKNDIDDNEDGVDSGFSLHIAVDFGTDGLGLAFAIDNKVFVHQNFKGKKFGATVKPKTIILLDDEGEVNAFGMDAKFTYMNLKQKDKWMLFERFKMSLFEEESLTYFKNDDDDNKDNKNKINIGDTLTALNGKIYPSEKVFVAAYKHIEKEAMKFLRKKKIKPKKEEIQWILTVPAIWCDRAKYKMKEWIIKSGLVNENIDNQCKIVYEPDCASLAIQYFIKENTFNNNNNNNNEQKQDFNTGYDELNINEFKKGEKYILIDAGGGTSDIACHEILGEFGAKEIWHPSGGPWGSCYIDDEYIKILKQIFNKKWINEFKLLHPNLYIELIYNFQKAKETFFIKRKSYKHNCRLPQDFISFIEEKIDEKNDNDDDNMDEIEKMVKNAKILNKNHLVALNEEFLEINVTIWEYMFDHVINPTIEHIKDLLKKPRMIRNCKYLCLVGGLSSSLYFQYKMENAFGPKSNYKMQIIIPKRPILSVVQGAAYFGITNHYIKARRLRKSYGISAAFPEEECKSAGIPLSFIQKNVRERADGKRFVVDCVDVIAKKNEEFETGKIAKKLYSRAHKTDYIRINIVCSDMDHPYSKEQTTYLGTLQIAFDQNDQINTAIFVEFHFYETTIQVRTYQQNNPNKKKWLKLNYSS